ncbi:kinase-like protein [Ceratobasidium sp. AG-I]|nr:kinase-like protein [Ceratobasidium sp. AG-I]
MLRRIISSIKSPHPKPLSQFHYASWQAFVEEYLAQLRKWVPLNNTNVIEVFELGDVLNLQVEFCEYGCVRDYLKASTQVVNKEIMILDVLCGLEYLHTRSPPLVHGNLNAGKIFVHKDGTTKIGEFGLAALCHPFSALVPSISFIGHSRWMSPELIDVSIDEPVVTTTASDIWAIGCTLYEIFHTLNTNTMLLSFAKILAGAKLPAKTLENTPDAREPQRTQNNA